MITEELKEKLFKYPKFDTITQRSNMCRIEYDNLTFSVSKEDFETLALTTKMLEERINECTICGLKGLRPKSGEQTRNSLGLFDSVITYYIK